MQEAADNRDRGQGQGHTARYLDERDLAAIRLELQVVSDRLSSQIAAEVSRNSITWDAYKHETKLHAENHGNEHARDGEARKLALEGMEKRLEGMNEFRNQLKEQAATFARVEGLERERERINALEKNIPQAYFTKEAAEGFDKRLDVIEKYMANIQGRIAMLVIVWGVVVVVISIAIRFL
jgi:hypothetical protein